MKRTVATLFLVVLLAGLVGAGSGDGGSLSTIAPAAGRVAFVPVEVWVDPRGAALACYQVEVTVTAGDATLVGIEGGEHRAYEEAPYYDRRALTGQRIILAAYSTAGDLPTGPTRVATLMFRVAGATAPAYAATLQVAASPDAKPIGGAATTLRPVGGAMPSTADVRQPAPGEGALR